MGTRGLGISWVLVPVTVPFAAKSLHYAATATCVHGETLHHIVTPRLALLDETIEALGAIHTQQTGCECRVVEYVVKEHGNG